MSTAGPQIFHRSGLRGCMVVAAQTNADGDDPGETDQEGGVLQQSGGCGP
jgi:hypothetical protein